MILFWDKPIAVERHICGSNSTAVSERLSESLGLLRVFAVISASWIALIIGLLMTIGGAEAQTTTGTAGTGSTLFSTTFNCHLCHAANSSNRFNAINAGGHIAYANSKGMGGTVGTAQQFADIAAYLATQFTDLGPQSVTFGTATPITIPNIALNTVYGGYVGLQAVSGPSRGSVSFSSTSATYTPAVNQCGSDSFTYQAIQSAANGSGTSNTRTVSLTISNPTVPTVTNNATSGTYNIAFNYNIATSGGTPTSYAASGLPTGLSINTSTGAITGTPTAAGTYTPSITASNCFNGGTQTSATVNPTFTIAKVAQVTLTANAASTSLTYLGTTNLSTVGGSGTGAVTYAVTTNPANCTISGTTLTAAGVGSCIVTATKAANANYFVASGTVSIMINPAAQTPLSAVATPVSINFGATSTLSTTGGSGTGAVTYSVTTNPANCTISVSTLSGAGVGSCTVTAIKAADTNYNAATSTVVVTVNATVPGAPTIGAATAGDTLANIAFSAPASGGGSPITSYTASCTPSGTRSNSVSPISVIGLANGTQYTCSVKATNTVGSSTASGTVMVTPTPTPLAPTFSSAASTSFNVGTNGSFNLTAIGTPSNMNFSLISGTLPSGVTLTSAGVLSGTPASGTVASYPVIFKADNTTAPAATQNFTLTVAGTPQSINFTAPATQTYGAGPATLTATATSGLTVTFSTVPSMSTVCSVSGASVTLLSSGNCTIAANQSGNTTYAAATQVNQAFTISQGSQATLIANAATTVLAFGGTTTLSTIGGSGTGAVSYASNNGNCTIVSSTLTAAGVGSCIVTATKAADTNYLVASTTVGITINQAAQATLTAIATPAMINFGATSTLSTTGGSGTGAVSYASNNGNCTIAGTTLTGAGTGSCTVTATKAADTNFNSTTGSIGVTVNATVAGAPTIGTATAASGQASITFTAPASNGGSVITGYTATCLPSGTGSSATSPVIVSGLANGTSYSCTVVTNNAIGSGAASMATAVTPTSQGPALWTNTCSGCHGSVPAGNRFNAAGVTGTILNYVRQAQPAMASIQGIQDLTATDLADIAAYILQYVPPVSVTTRFNTPKVVSVSSQITLNTISFGTIGVTGNPINGTLSAPVGTALTYTPNAGFVGTDSFTYRGVGTPGSPGTLFGENRTVSIQVLMPGVITVPAAPAIGTATPAGGKATVNFTPPTDDGGSPITGYAVTCDPGGAPVTVAGAGSPITVAGLTDGLLYFCSVTATNTMGTSAVSATVDVTPLPILLAAVSRKTHGPAGPFDIIIDTSQLIGGLVTTEPRASDAGGAGHKVVFQFDGPITAAGAPDILNALGAPVGNVASVVANGNAVEVTCTGIPDNTRVTVSLVNVNNIVNASASIGFLVGDVNNSRTVNASDISGVKARSGKPTDASNFKFDLNASGDISSSDISAVKARSGIVLTP